MPGSALPPPSAGLAVFHVALGRGTQNYSCAAGVDPSTAPTALGATANLYNVTCMASACTSAPSSQHPLDQVPALALYANQQPPPEDANNLTPLGSGSVLSGHHYFTNATTPTFNLVQGGTNYGIFFSKKAFNVTAPPGAANGTDGSTAVTWLKLHVETPAAPSVIQQVDYRPNVKEIYRVNTAGGNPPKTCDGMPTTFEIQYAAEYWFYG
ncbi:hypothetical protein ABVK25_006593 [Lepraria finkii]|uniref:Malate dehydrogenase n=1 Tax=Lepraria finkii TaxID=1340010 RepID=A0ABR4B763_9LECA